MLLCNNFAVPRWSRKLFWHHQQNVNTIRHGVDELKSHCWYSFLSSSCRVRSIVMYALSHPDREHTKPHSWLFKQSATQTHTLYLDFKAQDMIYFVFSFRAYKRKDHTVKLINRAYWHEYWQVLPLRTMRHNNTHVNRKPRFHRCAHMFLLVTLPFNLSESTRANKNRRTCDLT